MKTRGAVLAAVFGLLVVLIVLFLVKTPPQDTPPPSAGESSAGLPLGDKASPMPSPDTCRLGNKAGSDLPDPRCTPGAVNPEVNQANIKDTICKSGWTKTIRPSTSVTGRMKIASAKSYGLDPADGSEYDHLVSLQLGGAPDDPRNLWVEPGKIPNAKDNVENKLNDAVCDGLIPLATAQRTIAASWPTALDDAGLKVTSGHVCLRDNPTRCVGGHQSDTD